MAQMAGLYTVSSALSIFLPQIPDVCWRDIGLNRGAVRYLLENMDWLDEELGGFEDEYLIIDCPGRLSAFPVYVERTLTEE